jgi:gamma-glutamylcyclotransferase (GGCT)/AIG2-like uncharacterized protein YtfP
MATMNQIIVDGLLPINKDIIRDLVMKNNLLFCYGILMRNFELDLSQYGGKFIQEDEVRGRLYSIGSGVGLRLSVLPVPPDIRAKGEVWEVPEKLWGWLDSIEGNGRVYIRRLVKTISAYECWTYEHIYYDYEAPQKYGTLYPLIPDGVYRRGGLL